MSNAQSLSVTIEGPLASAIRGYAAASGIDPVAAALELATTGVVRRRALADHEVVRRTQAADTGPAAVKAAAVAKALSDIMPGVGRRIPTDPAQRDAARLRAEKELERLQARLAKLGPVATMPTTTSVANDKASGKRAK